MGYRVIEAFARSKRGEPRGGDDVLVLTPHFAGVLDGSSSRATVGGMSSGRFAPEVGADAIAPLHPYCDSDAATSRVGQSDARSIDAGL